MEFLIISKPVALPPKESSLSTEQETELIEQPVEEAAPAETVPETSEATEESEEK